MNEYGFHDQLVPTPKEIVYKMIKDVGLSGRYNVILEPSAGNGDIAEILLNYGKVYCIENNVNSLAILKEKEFTIIDYDFLQSNPNYSFDYIIMNPPFENGSKHLLHAWNILRQGKIACLLNKETTNNLFSKERQLLNDIIEKNGKIIEYGRCFKGYNVDVVCVILEKRESGDPLFDVDLENEKVDINFDVKEENMPALQDKIGNIVQSYETVKNLIQDMIKINNEVDRHINYILRDSSYTFNKEKAEMFRSISDTKDSKSKRSRYLNFLEVFQNESWESIFKLTQFEQLMTERVRKQFDNQKRDMQNLCFTKNNIQSLLFAILENSKQILTNCLLDVFDEFTKYHEENRVYVKGWKTNNQWMVKKKVILPSYISNSWGKFSTNVYRYNALDDIDRAMCVISGKKIENIVTVKSVVDECKAGVKNKKPTFFNITCYKALTIHLEFKEKELWEKFNFLVAKERKWIPNNYKESDMKKLLIE